MLFTDEFFRYWFGLPAALAVLVRAPVLRDLSTVVLAQTFSLPLPQTQSRPDALASAAASGKIGCTRG